MDSLVLWLNLNGSGKLELVIDYLIIIRINDWLGFIRETTIEYWLSCISKIRTEEKPVRSLYRLNWYSKYKFPFQYSRNFRSSLASRAKIRQRFPLFESKHATAIRVTSRRPIFTVQTCHLHGPRFSFVKFGALGFDPSAISVPDPARITVMDIMSVPLFPGSSSSTRQRVFEVNLLMDPYRFRCLSSNLPVNASTARSSYVSH